MSKEPDIKEKAADALEDLAKRVDQGYAEISRIYEIVSVLHQVAIMYLDSSPAAETKEQEEAIAIVENAVFALEQNMTMDQAQLAREEEVTE